jgi:hypothetical protein
MISFPYFSKLPYHHIHISGVSISRSSRLLSVAVCRVPAGGMVLLCLAAAKLICQVTCLAASAAFLLAAGSRCLTAYLLGAGRRCSAWHPGRVRHVGAAGHGKPLLDRRRKEVVRVGVESSPRQLGGGCVGIGQSQFWRFIYMVLLQRLTFFSGYFFPDPWERVILEIITKGENGRNDQENPPTIFTRISFYSIGNENRKVRNGIRSVKSDPSKTDKSEQKCPSIDRQTVI